MKFVIHEDIINKITDIETQLKMLEEMCFQINELNLSGEGIGVFMKRLCKDLHDITDSAYSTVYKDNGQRISPNMLTQIIATASGTSPILGRDMNRITLHLRECLAVDDSMKIVSNAWENFVTQGEDREALTLASMEGFHIKYDKIREIDNLELGRGV